MFKITSSIAHLYIYIIFFYSEFEILKFRENSFLVIRLFCSFFEFVSLWRISIVIHLFTVTPVTRYFQTDTRYASYPPDVVPVHLQNLFRVNRLFVSLSCPFVCDRGWLLAELDEIGHGWGLYVVMRFGQGLCGKKLTFAELCLMRWSFFWDMLCSDEVCILLRLVLHNLLRFVLLFMYIQAYWFTVTLYTSVLNIFTLYYENNITIS